MPPSPAAPQHAPAVHQQPPSLPAPPALGPFGTLLASLPQQEATSNPPRHDAFGSVAVSFREAKGNEQWERAMHSEMESHRTNTTWTAVERPRGVPVLPTKWVLRVKDDGRHKARLVALGNLQQGDPEEETYSPVARESTVRVGVALTAQYHFEWEQLDVKTAYLNGLISEAIYLLPPQGYEAQFKGKVLKLNRAIYGLRQSGLRWNECITDFLRGVGFQQSALDPCLFMRFAGKELIGIIVLYVDDITIACRNKAMLNELRASLISRFDMNVLGEPERYLGMNVKRDATGITLCQEEYIDKMLIDFGLQEARPQATPSHQRPECRAPDDEAISPAFMREAVGRLLYLARGTRPDIACIVGQLARFQTDPGVAHLCAIKRVLRYLKGTKQYGLFFPAGQRDFQLRGYADSDHAGDTEDRKSTGGSIFFLGGAPITWRSKKQAVVALSSTESEYVSLGKAAQEAVYLRNLLIELHVMPADAPPVVLFEDNQAAIAICCNQQYHGRLKHVDVQYHFIRDCVRRGVVKVQYCPTSDMIADIMTKPLPATTLQRLVRSIFQRAQ